MRRKQKIKIIRGLSGVCMLSGFITIMGLAGASDLNLIDFNTLLVRSCIAVMLMLIGYAGLKLTRWKYIL